MAKGNLFLGFARGRVGSVVFSRRNGQQISRALATDVKNPRSMSQSVQRAVFATVAKATSALYPIVNHSFFAETRTGASLNAFSKANLDLLRTTYLDGGDVFLAPKGASSLRPNNYLVSRGSYGTVSLATFEINSMRDLGLHVEELTATGGLTWDSFKSLFDNLAGGDEIAVVRIVRDSTQEDAYSVNYDRVVLSPTIEEYSGDVINGSGFVEGLYDPTKTTDASLLYTTSNQGVKYVKVAYGTNSDYDQLVGAAVIVSHYDIDRARWTVTNSSITCFPEIFALAGNEAAIETYMNGTSNPSSDWYLEQSTGDSVVINGSSGINTQIDYAAINDEGIELSGAEYLIKENERSSVSLPVPDNTSSIQCDFIISKYGEDASFLHPEIRFGSGRVAQPISENAKSALIRTGIVPNSEVFLDTIDARTKTAIESTRIEFVTST